MYNKKIILHIYNNKSMKTFYNVNFMFLENTFDKSVIDF